MSDLNDTAEAASAELDVAEEPSADAFDAGSPATAKRRAAARATAPEPRIHDEPAFLLHSYPYKETSLIVEALTRHHGRLALVARGAKRPRSALRSVLRGF